MEWKILKITLDFRCLKVKYVIISLFKLVGYSEHIYLSVEWLLLSEECILWTAITKQVTGDKKYNARKTQAFVLERKTYRVCHLLSLLQIFQNTCSSSAHLIIWVVLISFPTELHESLIYTWIWSPYQICDLQIFFFHPIGCHFILLMASFTTYKVLSLMWSH